MSKPSEPNAQNSEINPQAHPSGARIERLMKNAAEARSADEAGKGQYGEFLRPSEREDSILQSQVNLDEPAEGARERDAVETPNEHVPGQAPHRGHRDSRAH